LLFSPLAKNEGLGRNGRVLARVEIAWVSVMALDFTWFTMEAQYAYQ
jgi:hypothetical protein